MPPNETTVLLTNYREKHNISSSRNGYGCNSERERVTQDTGSHVVQVSKDSTEYEPIFSIEDYSSALTLAELLPYQDDPWWQRLRRILFLAFWLILVMTLVTACLLSYLKLGQLSCGIIDQQMLLTTAISPAAATSGSVFQPTTLAGILTTQLSDTSSKLALATVP